LRLVKAPGGMLAPLSELVRSRLRIRGVVQGVGFRPTVFRLAAGAGLHGFVRNDSEGVTIEIEGEAAAVEAFPSLLRSHAPPRATIEKISIEALTAIGEVSFRVVDTLASSAAAALIPPDLATCDHCIAELFDPADRRYRYPFINCTDCGPRFTIVRALPYDRRQTTMEPFTLCPECRAEYENPADRRFHAEPNACPACGPSLYLLERDGVTARGNEALQRAIAALSGGLIVAVKGIGGFHLAVDARSDDAVSALRQRKQRPARPLAVMPRDLEIASSVAWLDESAAEILRSPERPIVLLRARAGALPTSIAPALDEVGLMLPYTPLHHIMLREGPPLLVMTSGNRADEPIAIDDTGAASLLDIADLVLSHDREILTRADDSVVRLISDRPQPLRRSRGFVPRAIRLGFEAPPVLAVGAELKNTICVTRGEAAFLSPHVGDLSSLPSYHAFEAAIDHLESLLDVGHAAIAHDLHPDYQSTRWALRSPSRRLGVQHHHAHVASCCIDNGHLDRVIGVAFDGTGCGPAGELWGGEFLVCDLNGFERKAWLRPIRLPGGEMAIRQPWRLAAAALLDAGEPLDLLERIEPSRLHAIVRLASSDLAAPATSAGRWFDAVAALCGVGDTISYEAQAAIELEALAADGQEPYPFSLDASGAGHEIDLRPMVRALAADLRAAVEIATVAGRFHQTMAAVIAFTAGAIRQQTALATVALSGGCFQNRKLTEAAVRILERENFEVLLHRQVPANDGGIALGQAAIAAWRLRQA
jgi:hydrogenase maturation protein HypF